MCWLAFVGHQVNENEFWIFQGSLRFFPLISHVFEFEYSLCVHTHTHIIMYLCLLRSPTQQPGFGQSQAMLSKHSIKFMYKMTPMEKGAINRGLNRVQLTPERVEMALSVMLTKEVWRTLQRSDQQDSLVTTFSLIIKKISFIFLQKN